ncbi:thiol peroxidase [Streptococcus pneumoniae]|nr:thiol peroxidase [Streptococcus pneumoniae]
MVTFLGNPVSFTGKQLQVGDKALDFSLTVSMDLPFAQKRWCGAEGLDNAIMLSDYFDHSFGRDYALLINEWHLLARAVFVLDTDNTIRYVEYVDNINSEPNFEAAIAAAKAL